jgi:translocation and assembly module TamB
VIGRFAGGSGKLANVPLLLSGRGRWSVQRGDLAVDGGDDGRRRSRSAALLPARHQRLPPDARRQPDRATGWLNDPETGTRVTRADIATRCAPGRGNAVLDVPGIRFDEATSPSS